MPVEFWIYGGLMVAAGLVAWRIAMQYYTYLEDAYNHSEMTRNQLRSFLRGTGSSPNGPAETGNSPPKTAAPTAPAKTTSKTK